MKILETYGLLASRQSRDPARTSLQLNRRMFLLTSLGLCPLPLLITTPAFAASEQGEVSVQWAVPSERLETVVQLLSDESIEFEKRESTIGTRAEPVTILVATVAIASLLTTIFELYQRWDNPGIVIDARAGDLKVSSLRGLDPGTVVVLSDRETVSVEISRDRSSLERLASVVGEATR